MKRRRSRQSVNAPTIIDYEYVGNVTATMREAVKKHDKHQLDFELNLRQYADTGSFKTEDAWLYPAPKSFIPAVVLSPFRDRAEGTLYDPAKNTFNDRYGEKNMNAILHTLDRTQSFYRNAEWQVSLRGDRK